MGGFSSIWHWVIVLLVIILLFGAKRIPELAKSLGSGIKNFKKAVKEDEDELQLQEFQGVEEESKKIQKKTDRERSVKKTTAKAKSSVSEKKANNKTSTKKSKAS